MGWWLTLIGAIIVVIGGLFSVAGILISPKDNVYRNIFVKAKSITQYHSGIGDNVAGDKTIINQRAFFSDTQSIKNLPPSLGGNDILNLDNLATLKLHVPYNENSLTLLLNVIPTEMPTVKNESFTAEGIKIYNQNSGQSYFFNTIQNKSHKIQIENRFFVVSLKEIKKLDIKNVSNPLEFIFGISEIETP
ncbi:hypothetical protein KJ590_02230 [Patescibacteria group bacterium]|nr:hypothetical protein [Patescibacteria group bacterium]